MGWGGPGHEPRGRRKVCQQEQIICARGQLLRMLVTLVTALAHLPEHLGVTNRAVCPSLQHPQTGMWESQTPSAPAAPSRGLILPPSRVLGPYSRGWLGLSPPTRSA